MRIAPRIGIEALCWELDDGAATETHARIVDLSPDGARIERPYVGGATRRDVPLLLDVPGIDEVLWARGEAMFDHLVPSKSRAAGPLGLIRRTGYRIIGAAARDLRLIRELVLDTHYRRTSADQPQLGLATCYARA